ncbi:MAG TPA: YvcK family protein [Candidatus Omnitrophota bacterium]|nr:YvcK family protein [Candidatus Omnitrophota bacterium]
MKRSYKLDSAFKWLYPGMRIKRWVSLSLLGIILILIGVSGAVSMPRDFSQIIIYVYYANVIFGIILIILGFKNMMVSVVSLLLPHREGRLIDIMFQKRFLEHGPKIVAIGGGTGLSTILHGIKEYTSNITAIVTVADDGGSSGRLRQQFDMVAPGDIRNCLVALANEETMMRELFQYRFEKETEFSGHSFGNLFITAMTQVTGDFEKALKESSKILSIRGRVLPSTLEKVTLAAEHQDGRIIEGEAKIPDAGSPVKRIFVRPEGASAAPEAVKAIKEAELIILGPGSLYTSIIPNLILKEIREAVVSAHVTKIYVCNIMTQPGETDNFKASDHVKELVRLTHPNIIDACIVNVGRMPKELLSKYASENSIPVIADADTIKEMGYGVIEEDLVSASGLIRHDADKLARIISNLMNLEKSVSAKA